MSPKICTRLLVALVLLTLIISSYQISPVKSAKTMTVDERDKRIFTQIQPTVDGVSGLVGAATSVQNATGLKEPGFEQKEWINRNFPIIQKINLNKIALERINQERTNKGLNKLSEGDINIVSVGAELSFSTPQPTGTTTASIALPIMVDNSQLSAFPPIRSQGAINSCVAWATTYYQYTYENNLALGRDAKGPGGLGVNANIFSPKWTYNMINDGVDGGSFFSHAYSLLLMNGATSWSTFPYDSNYLQWCTNPQSWREAINYKAKSGGTIYNSDVDVLINDYKTQLANGHVIVIGTAIYSWVSSTIGDDLSTTEDNPFVGQIIATYMRNTMSGSHAMTVVGYNDAVWCDMNSNGVVDQTEKGAFKIANSWGTGDWNQGYRWVTYDSLKGSSVIPKYGTWPTDDRAVNGIFVNGQGYILTVAAYQPKMVAEFTLNQLNRGQILVTLGSGAFESTTPFNTWTSGVFARTRYSGGAYAFDGSMFACDATFYLDFTELTPSTTTNQRWFLTVTDSVTGNPTIIKGYNLYEVTATGDILVGSSSETPKTVDGSHVNFWIDYKYNSLVSISLKSLQDTGATSNMGTITFSGTPYTLPGTASKTPASYSASYFPTSGYAFDHWEIAGSLSVTSSTANPTTVNLVGDGTLTAVYKQSAPPPSYNVQLTSQETPSTTSNRGSVTFDGVSYTTLPRTVTKTANTYTVSYAPTTGYQFDHWTTMGAITIASADANPATVTVSGAGTLNAVYKITSSQVLFSDGFESGGFSAWTSYYLSTGEVRATSTTYKHHGTYSARFTTNGGGGNEYAYQYKTITATNDLYLRGYFYVSQSGLAQNGDKMYMLNILSGTNGVVFAGWARDGGVNKWVLVTRNNGVAVFSYSSASPSLNKWYCVEIHFKGDPINGAGELFVDGVKVCSISGKNTANYGSANRIQCGFSYLYSCASSRVYMDCVVASKSYIGPELSLQQSLTIQVEGSGSTTPAVGTQLYSFGASVSVKATPSTGWKFDHWVLDGVNVAGPNPYIVTMGGDHTLKAVFTQVIVFSDDFESGSFSKWTGTRVSYGETATVTSSVAKFTSNGGRTSEYSNCYVTITPTQEVYVKGTFTVTQSGITDSNGRFYLLGVYNTDTWVALSGWRRDSGGVLRWALIMNNGNTGVIQYSTTTPALNTGYNVELHWYKALVGGYGELWVNGAKVCSITNIDTAYKGDANKVQVGLPIITSCGLTTVYGDSFVISKNYIGN